MALKSLVVQKFGDGLITAVDKALLPPGASWSLSNVDVTDSDTIERRNGYARVSATLGASAVDALSIFYKADGSSYFMAVCGTALLAAARVTAYPTRRKELTLSNTTGGASEAYLPGYSAGNYVGVNVGSTLAATVPSCNVVTFGPAKSYLGTTVAASYKVDSGSWVTATGPYSVSVSATQHTLSVKTNQGANWAFDYIDYALTSTFTHKDSTVSATPSVYAFAVLNDLLYYGSKYDQIRSFDGTNTAAVTASGSTNAAFLTQFKRRLWASGSLADDSLLECTDVDYPEDWTGGESIHLAGKDSGGQCTGLGIFDNRVFYFTPSRVYTYDPTGEPTAWVATTLPGGPGCIAPKSLAAAPNALVFLASDGVRSYGYLPSVNSPDGSGFGILSANIKPTLDAFTDAQKAAAVGCVYKGRYWLAIGGTVLICDLEKRASNGEPVWTQYTYTGGLSITCFCVSRGDELALYAGSSDGKVYQLDTGESDNGSAIAYSYNTPPLLGNYNRLKHIRMVYVGVDSDTVQSMTVTPTTDDVAGMTQTLSVSSSTSLQPLRALLSSRGRYISLAFSGSGQAQPIALSSLELVYTETPPR